MPSALRAPLARFMRVGGVVALPLAAMAVAVLASATVRGNPPVTIVPYPYGPSATASSDSMVPTIECSNRRERACRARTPDLLVQDLSGARLVRRGDIVWFREPDTAAARHYCGDARELVTHRVIGVGDDHVVVRHGVVTLNGRLLREPYVPRSELGGPSGSWRVPKGAFFILGNNRAVACDSRYYGPVPATRIGGRVVEIIRRAPGGSDPVGPPIKHARYPYETASTAIGVMAPTINCANGIARNCRARSNDVVLVELSGARFITRGDIVSFHEPFAASRYCGGVGIGIARVIGLPGERVTEHEGAISINGAPLSEPYVARYDRGSGTGAWHVPTNALFVLDDYRAGTGSCDSHLWGPLLLSLVRGRVVEIFRAKTQR